MRRRVWGVAVLTALLVATQAALPAVAGGVIAPPADTRIGVSHERAILSWDGATETMIMQLDLDGAVGGAGIVVPTPHPATVTAADPALFDVVEGAMTPNVVTTDDWWGASLFQRGPAEPVVLDRVQLGPIEAVTLAASDAIGLDAWLTANGFSLSLSATNLLATYVRDGWSFVALKLTTDTALDGAVDPIQFTFPADEFVYPLRLSQAAVDEQSIRLYVLDEARTVAINTNPSARPINSLEKTVWAGPVTDDRLTPLGAYLTVMDLTFTTPSIQVTSDLEITRSAATADVIPTVKRYQAISLLGVPLGLLMVGWLGIGVVIVIGFIVHRRRT